jgi:hypothetical protein
MSRSGSKAARKAGSATGHIPVSAWSVFLKDFGDTHRRWITTLETTDHVTKERVVSPGLPLESLEFDLEDEKNPRINVIVRLDNKILKHILFRPSQLILHESAGGAESLEIETVNTSTRIHFGQKGEGAS